MFDLEANAGSQAFITSNLVGTASRRPAGMRISPRRTPIFFSARMVNNFLASYGRNSPNFSPVLKNPGPFISFNDGTDGPGGWNGAPQNRVQNTFQYLDTLTYTIGAHTLKAGYELNRIQANSSFDSNVRGSFTFNSFDDFQNGVSVQLRATVRQFGARVSCLEQLRFPSGRLAREPFSHPESRHASGSI